MIALLACSSAFAQGPPPAAVRVDAARMETVQEHRLVTGEVKAVRRARVATEEGSLLVELNVIEGDRVAQGDLLARLDSRRLEIELTQLDAEREVALAELEEKKAEAQWHERDLQNYQDLAQRGAGNPKELYDAEWETRIAQAKVSAGERHIEALTARANLLRRRIEDTTIRAPFDGVVVAKFAEPGEWLDIGGAVIELVSTAEVDVWLDVPQQYADALLGVEAAPAVTVNIEATGAAIETRTIRAIPVVDPTARTFQIVARLENSKGLLAPGMSATAWVPTGDVAQRLTIPKDAIARNEVGAFVYVVRQGGGGPSGGGPPASSSDGSAPGNGAPGGGGGPAIAAPTDVKILFNLKDRVVVQAPGLADGDMLVVEGNERLFPMASIIPMPVQAAGGPAAPQPAAAHAERDEASRAGNPG